MAMHQPTARIVRLEAQHQEAARRQRGRVPAGRVVEFQDRGGGGVVALALGEHEGVVAVEVDRVGGGRVGEVVEDPVDPCVGLGDGVDVVRGWEDGAAVGDDEVGGVGPVEVEGGVVDRPF